MEASLDLRLTPFSIRIWKSLVAFGIPTPINRASSELKTFLGSPSKRILPSLMTIIRSAYLDAKSNRCSTRTIVILRSSFNSFMTSKIFCAPIGSRDDVGSSSIMTSGRIASTDAIATRCCCPPESSYGARSRRSQIPVVSRAQSTRFRIFSLGKPRFSSPKATSFSTDRAKSWFSGFWKTNPTC